MSPRFVDLTQKGLERHPNVRYLVLGDGDITQLPAGSFSLVALRYVLHHILDWRGFLRDAGTLLAPGSSILMEEPCSEGFLVQAIAMRSVRERASTEVKAQIDRFVETILWYLRTDVDKSASEDKHLFDPPAIFEQAANSGMSCRFWRNYGLDSLGEPMGPDTFVWEFRNNLTGNFGFSGEILELFESHVVPLCDPLLMLSPYHHTPCVKGVFLLRKESKSR